MNGGISLNDLIASLGAGEGQEKQASETAQVSAPTVADELKSTLLTKVASERKAECEDLGRQLAARLLEKAASEKEEAKEKDEKEKDEEKEGEKEGKGQEKEASDFSAHVASLLQKKANEAGTSAQENLAVGPTAAMAAEQSKVDNEAQQSGGTVEQQQNESLQKGLTSGTACAGADDKVEAGQLKAAAVAHLVGEGLDFYDAFDMVKEADSELQKEAAYNHLVSEGYSVEDAIALVKQASEMDEVAAEEFEKSASFSGLLAEGYTFDEAEYLMKEAGVLSAAKDAIKKEVKTLSNDVDTYRKLRKVNPQMANIRGKHMAANAVKRNKAGLGSAAAGAAAVGAASAMQKKAALDELLGQGYDFDEAAQIVKEAGLLDAAKAVGGAIKGSVSKEVGTLKSHYQSYQGLKEVNPALAKKVGKGLARDAVVRNKIPLGVAGGVAALGTAGVAGSSMSKQASLNQLLADGVSFDEAVAHITSQE